MDETPSHRRHGFDGVALLLQGGGALGSYQAGVYEALAETHLERDWLAGIPIGAINAALIAGNSREERVARLREFWNEVSSRPLGIFSAPYLPQFELQLDFMRRMVNQSRAMGIAMFGAPGLFSPGTPLEMLMPAATPDKLS